MTSIFSPLICNFVSKQTDVNNGKSINNSQCIFYTNNNFSGMAILQSNQQVKNIFDYSNCNNDRSILLRKK